VEKNHGKAGDDPRVVNPDFLSHKVYAERGFSRRERQ
jgi:hypothetical protein